MTIAAEGSIATRRMLAGEPTEDDRKMAFYAHLFASLGNLVSAGVLLPIICACVPLLLTQSRHPFLVFHINQSAAYQLLLFVLNAVLAAGIGVLSIFTCGIGAILFVLCAIPPIIGIVHPVIIGLAAKRGEWAGYPWVGEKVMTNSPVIG